MCRVSEGGEPVKRSSGELKQVMEVQSASQCILKLPLMEKKEIGCCFFFLDRCLFCLHVSLFEKSVEGGS